MKLAIISDIHDNLNNLQKCLIWCRDNKVEKIICAGDVTNSQSIEHLATNFTGEIFLVSGNCELYHENELTHYPNLHYCGEIGVLEIDRLSIGLCHEEKNIPKVFQVSPKPLDFIFYGHSHKPWLNHKEQVFLVNPGNIAGVFHQATFATLETKNKKLELKILADL